MAFEISKNLVAIDVETSGVNPFEHQILSIALVPLTSNLPTLEVYIYHDEINWQPTARKMFANYLKNWVDCSKQPRECLLEIEQFIEENFSEPITLIGHNIAFDMGFFKQLIRLAGRSDFPNVSHRTVDTHSILYFLADIGIIPRTALTSDGAFEHFGIEIAPERRHTSAGDAQGTRDLYLRLAETVTAHQKSRGSKKGFRQYAAAHRVLTYKDSKGRYRFRLVAENGRVLEQSEAFNTKRECLSAAKKAAPGLGIQMLKGV